MAGSLWSATRAGATGIVSVYDAMPVAAETPTYSHDEWTARLFARSNVPLAVGILTDKDERRAAEAVATQGGTRMTGQTRAMIAKAMIAALTMALASFAGATAQAQDKLKIAIGQINNWENQAPTLGQDVGIYKKLNLELENFGTAGAGETMQPIISGSADIGAGVGIAGVMRAFVRGAPVRILAPMFTGTSDLYWYVRADSPIKSLKDATDRNTIAYSTSGSSSNNIVLAFVSEFGTKAKPTATGGLPGTLTAVMSGQIDIGWAAPPFGLQEQKDGKIRIIARGNDVKSLAGQTARVLIVNADSLKNRKDVVTRFLRGYRESVDWMYTNPDAVKRYSDKTKIPEELIRATIATYHTREAMQTDAIKDVEGIMRDAVTLKFLDKPLTPEQLAELIQIPPR
jgi:NitT/TauT family transport system substrate-binding protein